jgi:hypothetical protein
MIATDELATWAWRQPWHILMWYLRIDLDGLIESKSHLTTLGLQVRILTVPYEYGGSVALRLIIADVS